MGSGGSGPGLGAGLERLWRSFGWRFSGDSSTLDLGARLTAIVVIVGLLAALGIASLVDNRVTDLVTTLTVQRAIDQVGLGVDPLVQSDDFIPPFNQTRLDDLADRLDPSLARLQQDGVIRLNVLTPDGTIVYSDRPSIRGLQLPLSAPFLTALTGGYARSLTSLSEPEDADLRSRFSQALEVFAPVTIRGHVVGVYEIYENPSALQPLQLIVWGPVLGTLIPLFLGIYLASRTLSARIAREQREREQRARIEATADAAREARRLETELLSSVSHELRDPLSLIHGYAELLVNRSQVFGPDEIRRIASEINRGSRLMSRIVDDLLDFTRVGRGTLRLEPRQTDLVSVVMDTIDVFGPRYGFDRLIVEAPGPVVVRGDPQRLSQVTANLISNALRYAPTGPVRIRVDRLLDGRAMIQVRDYGPGISASALPHLWEMFYRTPEAVESGIPGTGIGLALVKHIVEAHGGTVEAESKLHEGATFRVFLPTYHEQDSAPGAPSYPLEFAGQGAPDLIRIAERIVTGKRDPTDAPHPGEADR